MKEGKPSKTAEMIAFCRAVESDLSESKRMFEDPLAKKFLRPHFRCLAEGLRVPGIRNICDSVVNHVMWAPGGISRICCRTIAIDNALRDALNSGCTQVVNLGAGYDCRAYRIEGAERSTFFEVDHPDTQAYKRRILGKALGETPPHVRFVPMDFNQDDLLDELQRGGFQVGKKTFYIWEGVTTYIPAEAVDRTLRFVVDNSASGSRIVFTYLHQGVIDGSWKETQRLTRKAARMREYFIFGLVPEEVPEFLSARSLSLIEDLGAAQFRSRYFESHGRVGPIEEIENTALAEV